MKVLTVTLNPAIDKTIYVDNFELYGTNRVQSSLETIGGKGINVSRNLRNMGMNSEILGVFAGVTGKRMTDALVDEHYLVHEISGMGETRINLKIVDQKGHTTELNELGPALQDDGNILNWFKDHDFSDTLIVLSGSIPKGVSQDIYGQIINLVKKGGAKVLLDASSKGLEHGLVSVPHIIKPNIDEVQYLLNIEQEPCEAELIEFGKAQIENGVKLVVISLGSKGALFMSDAGIYRADGLDLISKSTVGAGDAMVASLVFSYINQEDIETLIQRAIATSGAAVETRGTNPGELKRINALMKVVRIQEMSKYENNSSKNVW